MEAHAKQLTGQPEFADKGANPRGVDACDGLCWPYELSAYGQTVAVADSGNYRVLIWRSAT